MNNQPVDSSHVTPAGNTESVPVSSLPTSPNNLSSNNIIRRLYDWVLAWAETPYGTPALFVLSFIESSFFPIPPDVLQIALSASKPKRSFWYAAVSLTGSVLGAFLGFFIGFALWQSVDDYFYQSLFSRETFAFVAGDESAGIVRDNPEYAVEGLYHEHAFWAIFTAAFTPIPYKVFTIAAGVCQISLLTLFVASLLGRGARFGLVAVFMYIFGPAIRSWIDRYFNLLTIVFTLLLIGGFVLLKFVF